MTDIVIRAEGLSKKYVIGHETREHYTALRDVIARQARRLLRSARDMTAGRALISGDECEEFWPLRDLNFEVRRGEVVGIIGRNGAGKSTLLKVLSRITEPSEGRVTINGRIASLLEVGTGFHPELTGRENIQLNGAILGMSRAEIRRKFDEIVDFAGVEKFLDTPVKRYSSGMYVRLAFSVAAHLEPEILVVDEVLAVGDAEFQKKCLGKMKDVASCGRTILFVSHQMGAIKSLTNRCILLSQGQIQYDGSTNSAIDTYLSSNRNLASEAFFVDDTKSPAKILYWSIQNRTNPNSSNVFTVFDPIEVIIKFQLAENLTGTNFAFNITNAEGIHVLSTQDFDTDIESSGIKTAGVYTMKLTIPAPLLNAGSYYGRISVAMPGYELFDQVEGINFIIEDMPGDIRRKERKGLIITNTPWQRLDFQPRQTI